MTTLTHIREMAINGDVSGAVIALCHHLESPAAPQVAESVEPLPEINALPDIIAGIREDIRAARRRGVDNCAVYNTDAEILCDAVERHTQEMLVVAKGYAAMKKRLTQDLDSAREAERGLKAGLDAFHCAMHDAGILTYEDPADGVKRLAETLKAMTEARDSANRRGDMLEEMYRKSSNAYTEQSKRCAEQVKRIADLERQLAEVSAAYGKLHSEYELLKRQAPTPAAPCCKSAGLDLQAMDDMAILLSSKASAYEEDREVEVTDHIMDLRSASEMISMAASALAETKAVEKPVLGYLVTWDFGRCSTVYLAEYAADAKRQAEKMGVPLTELVAKAVES